MFKGNQKVLVKDSLRNKWVKAIVLWPCAVNQQNEIVGYDCELLVDGTRGGFDLEHIKAA